MSQAITVSTIGSAERRRVRSPSKRKRRGLFEARSARGRTHALGFAKFQIPHRQILRPANAARASVLRWWRRCDAWVLKEFPAERSGSRASLTSGESAHGVPMKITVGPSERSLLYVDGQPREMLKPGTHSRLAWFRKLEVRTLSVLAPLLTLPDAELMATQPVLRAHFTVHKLSDTERGLLYKDDNLVAVHHGHARATERRSGLPYRNRAADARHACLRRVARATRCACQPRNRS